MAEILLDHVSKSFGGERAVVQELSLRVASGELLVLVGPSGSGKSTLLRLIAGLEAPSSGQIHIGGRDVTAVSPAQRDLAMVFQNYALYPHKNVRDNMAFGLKMRHVPAAQIAERVAAAAAALGLSELLERRPAELSGGQRQRVALGRAIVRKPQAFLLDEPLSNLDPLLRVATRAELSLLHRRLETTMVYVTHDQEEAMTLGTRVAVLREGQIEQVGAPTALFDRPATLFVARFIGSPTINLWPAHRQATGRLVLDDMPEMGLDTNVPDGTSHALVAGVRPHDLELDGESGSGLPARIEIVEPLGATSIVHASYRQDAPLIRISVPGAAAVAVGDSVVVRVRDRQALLFDGPTGRRLPTGAHP